MGAGYQPAPSSGTRRTNKMEAASVPRQSPRQSKAAVAIRKFLSTYGLIIVLLILPVIYGIQDLHDDGNLVRLGQNFKDGISNGAIWALIALGYTLVYGIIELINFAHGDVFMLGSFVAVSMWTWLGISAGSSVIVIILGIAGVLIVSMLATGSLNVL